jgi:hypothetical protein
LEFTHPQVIAEAVPIRLVAYDPFWHEDGDHALALNTSTAIADADFVMKRVNGVWSNVSTSFVTNVQDVIEDRDGRIYFTGAFTNVGDANGDGIVVYDPATGALSSLGTGLNGNGQCLAITPEGNVLVGGAFADAGGVADTANLALWNVSSQVWQSVATGGVTGTIVLDVLYDQDGVLYITGNFTAAGGVAATRIAQKSGGTWSALGTGLNDSGFTLALSEGNVVYVGGSFTTANGVTVNRVAYWNGTTFVALGSGTNNIVQALWFSGGVLYLVGDFTQCNGASGFNYVASWNGSNYGQLGTGLGGPGYALATDDAGVLYTAETVAGLGTLMTWNGSLWANADIILPNIGAVYGFCLAKNGVFYLVGEFTGTATVAAHTDVTNGGTADSYPTLTISRSGGTAATLEWLRNDTTDDTIYLDYSLLDGETLTIDFTPGQRSITSNLFGLVWRAAQQRSQFATFRLIKGVNDISFWVHPTGSPTITAHMQWKNIHDSVDGVAA